MQAIDAYVRKVLEATPVSRRQDLVAIPD
jgi:hypothetical protein